MRLLLTGALLAGSRAGCGSGRTEHVGQARDTVITPRQTQDTTIVTTDTSVRTATTVRRGQGAVPEDTPE